MTSVLYSAGLNYQGSNPLRTEIRGIRNEIDELRKLIINQADAINVLNTRLAASEKALKAAVASIPTATTAPNSSSSKD
jgi:predicted  nucleic acid-binding Zn-ribbon protein